MKFLKLYFTLFILSHTSISNGQKAWANNIIIENLPCASPSSTCKQYKVKNIPINRNGDMTYGYSFFWEFADGTYYSSHISPNITEFTVEHNYLYGGQGNVSVQMAQHYDDTDKPVRIIGGGIPSSGISTFDELEDTLAIIPSLSPRKGDLATYVLLYKNPCKATNDLRGNIEFTFDAGKATVENFRTYGGETGGTISAGKFSFNFDNLPSNAYRAVFVDLRFSNSLLEYENMAFNIKMIPPLEGFCISSSDNIGQTLNIQSVREHDPNLIFSEVSSVCTVPPQTMKYTIVFQNIGTGPADSVTIKNILPACFLFSEDKIQMVDPPALPFTMEISTREITWRLTKNNETLKGDDENFLLSGTNQTGIRGDDGKMHMTLDSITYIVTFDKDYPLQPCGAIVNKAQIYFGKLPSIFTNTYYTRILCDSVCSSCNDPNKWEKMPTTTVDGTNPTINIPFSAKEYNLEWYPKSGLELQSGSTFLVKTDSSAIFTLVASKACERNILEIPIVVNPKEESTPCRLWLFLIALLASVFGLAFYARSKKRKNNNGHINEQSSPS